MLVKRDESARGKDELLVLSIHHPESPHGVCFDPAFVGAGWQVRRIAAVRPPLSIWEATHAGEHSEKELPVDLQTVNVPARSDAKETTVKPHLFHASRIAYLTYCIQNPSPDLVPC